MNAAEVLDHQADLIVRLENPTVRRAWTGQMEADMGVAQPMAWTNREGSEAVRSHLSASAAASLGMMTDAVRDASAFYITEDLTQLVVYAASQLNETDRISRELMPTRSGIARFAGGIPYRDVRGQVLRISWLIWGPAVFSLKGSRHDIGEPEQHFAVWMFNDQRDEPDAIARQIENELGAVPWVGRWGFIGQEQLVDETRLGPAWLAAPEEKTAYLAESGVIPMEFTNVKRLVHAFWLLLGQTVTEARDAQIDRARRKRAGRANIPPRVTVIQLRHVESRRAEGESLVEWNHRWPVRGHWHWFHCGENHPQAQEVAPGKFMCRLWLAPYVKGPADKPLVTTQKVYKLNR